jgi:hypothetical protein
MAVKITITTFGSNISDPLNLYTSAVSISGPWTLFGTVSQANFAAGYTFTPPINTHWYEVRSTGVCTTVLPFTCGSPSPTTTTSTTAAGPTTTTTTHAPTTTTTTHAPTTTTTTHAPTTTTTTAGPTTTTSTTAGPTTTTSTTAGPTTTTSTTAAPTTTTSTTAAPTTTTSTTIPVTTTTTTVPVTTTTTTVPVTTTTTVPVTTTTTTVVAPNEVYLNLHFLTINTGVTDKVYYEFTMNNGTASFATYSNVLLTNTSSGGFTNLITSGSINANTNDILNAGVLHGLALSGTLGAPNTIGNSFTISFTYDIGGGPISAYINLFTQPSVLNFDWTL